MTSASTVLICCGVLPWFGLTGCTHRVALFPTQDGATADGSGRSDAEADGPLPAISWGAYTESLNLPDCLVGATLLVNTTAFEVDGDSTDTLDDPQDAGATLSLVEALHIAANRPGQDNIVFDAAVFPADDPATILMTDTAAFPLSLGEVCIDGRGRGVVLRWEDGSSSVRLGFYGGAVMMGITLLAVPYEIELGQGQIAACRINTDGYRLIVQPQDALVRPWAFGVTRDGVLGPHNVIAGATFGMRTEGPATVRGNSFGYDPLTRQRIGLVNGLDVRFDVVIEDNIFAVDDSPIQAWPFAPPTPQATGPLMQIRGNTFGVTRDGAPIAGTNAGLSLVYSHGTIGPGNVVRGTEAAITLGSGTAFRITRNTISGNGAGIVFTDVVPTPPPSLARATATSVQGTCPVAGTVEVFSDTAASSDLAQGQQFVGETTCSAGGSFTLSTPVPIPPGRWVTATLTSEAEGLTSTFSSALPIS